MTETRYRAFALDRLLALSEPSSKPLRLRGFRDLLPSGHLAARAPVTVDWRRSNLGGDEPFVVLRGVNAGGNPLDRSVILNDARVPLNGIEYAEAIFTPLDPTGVSQHGQLRFVFAPGSEPVLTTVADADSPIQSPFEDLILSWEVWRYRDDEYTIRRALDEANPLTMRAYVGPQRFLEDTLQGHQWRAYRLSMPGGGAGATELLATALSLGDGVARHAIASMMDRVEASWSAYAPDGAEPEAAIKLAWEQLRSVTGFEGRPIDAERRDERVETTYNPLLRSCVAMMRYTILLATHRLIERGLTEGVALDRLPQPTLGASEPWMREAARCDLRGIFARAPLALDFLFRNPQALPSAIIGELDEAGLLARSNGKPDLICYGARDERPYGADGLRRRKF